MTGNSASPYWATNDFFAKALRKQFPDVTVHSCRVWFAIGKGDNYLSDLHRAEVEYTTKGKREKTTLIVKAMPEGNNTEQFITEIGVFPKEVSMYTVVIPKLTKLLNDAGVKVELSSECLMSSKNKPTCIVMRDLALGGYKMAQRTSGLDMKHCTLLLEKLAYMHAASIVMEQQDPKSVADYTTGFLQNDSEANPMNLLLLKAVDELSEATAVWKGFEKYSKKLSDIKGTILQQGFNNTKMKPNSINVLNHGDLWTNNMLFNYKPNGDPLDVMLVDFQMCVWTSLGIDLNYFLCTSLKFELLDKKDYFIEHYHRKLADCLKKLNYKNIPSLQDVKKEVREKALFAFIASALCLPLIVCDKAANGEAMDMEKLLDPSPNGKKARQSVYRGKTYEKMICSLLPYFDELGIFP